MSIKYDSTELLNSIYNPEKVLHENMPVRHIERQNLIGDDGSVIVSDRFGEKIIIFNGTLIGSSASDLDSKIDDLKELFSRRDKNLDIDYEGSTRRYVARVLEIDINREYYHLQFVPYEVKFLVPSGMGRNTSETTVINAESKTTTTPVTGNFSLDGTNEPLPTIEFEITGSGWINPKGIKFENTDNDEYIIFTTTETVNNGTKFKIYCEDKRVTYQLSGSDPELDIDFSGAFPSFDIGTNNYKITVAEFLFENFYDYTASNLTQGFGLRSSWRAAQSFILDYGETTFQKLGFILGIDGSTASNITIKIETDSSGEPSGSLAHANATFTIDKDDVPVWTSRDWVYGYTSSGNLVELNPNTKYWFVLEGGGSAGNEILIYRVTASLIASYGTYTKGFSTASYDSGATWSDFNDLDDFPFRLYIGGKAETSSLDLTVKNTPRYL